MNKVLFYRPNAVAMMPLDLTKADTLDKIYKVLGVDLITIPRMRIDGHFYDIITDDEGALIEDAMISLYYDGRPAIFGPFIITRYNNEGDHVGLNADEMERIMAHLRACLVETERSNGAKMTHFAMDARM